MNAFKAIEGLLFTRFSIFKSVCKLAGLELKLARLSIFPLLVWMFLLLPVLLTLWLTALLVAGYGLQVYLKNLWLTLAVLSFIQIGLVTFIFCTIKKHLNRMKLIHTRNYLNSHSLKANNELQKESSGTN